MQRLLRIKALPHRASNKWLRLIDQQDLLGLEQVLTRGVRFQEERTPCIQEDVGVAPNVVAGTLILDCIQVYAFVSCQIITKLHVSPNKLDKGVTISTHLGENIDIDDVYKWVQMYIRGYELRVDLMSLNLNDFDLILGMGQLSEHRAQIDCFTKTMTIQGKGGEKVVFKGVRKVMPNCMILVVIIEKLIRKECFFNNPNFQENTKQVNGKFHI